jgi:meso-butanediol dehydrogenase / (S,S)-butanediol dehydrogenase / diacetyl reductase
MTERRVALVTGSEGGIGSATVRALSEAGYAVVGADVASGADLVVDVATVEGARRAVATAVERHGRLDAVALTHGISGRRYGDGPVADCTDEGWNEVLSTNLRSVFYVCREAVPSLVAGGGGAIVAVGSVHGLVGGDRDFATHAYAASKAGLVGLVRAIAVHYAGDGVRANVVAPGLVRTPMSRRAQEDVGIVERLPELQPLGGTFIEPEDVAGAVVYLAQAERVTGAVLVVDAGWTAK